ncbi:hypothetical protein [Panacagrimonas sp.]|uniref:hypothetical protein n=1 Tax=Panacagrimonas sp. TaxID=2480088 RepID=UPI003B529E12
MNKPGRPVEPAESAEPAADHAAPPAGEAKRSAMRLPEGVTPGKPQRPALRKPWESQHGGRPQQDFARRAGRSRKVH